MLGSTSERNGEREFEISEPFGLIRLVEGVAPEPNVLIRAHPAELADDLPEVWVGGEEVVPYAVVFNELRRQHPDVILSIWINKANLPHVPLFAARGVGE